LTERIRIKAFATLLRQEVAYFDQLENNSHAINNRLSFDARSIQQMTGARFSILCEASVIIVVALILSFLFHYQLGLILFIYLTYVTIIIYLDIYLKARVVQRSRRTLEQATAVR